MGTRESEHHSQHDTRDRLISAAKCLFAEKGFNGTTVKELAEKAQVNISLVSYHFHGKEGLFRACLEQIGRSRLDTMQRILQPPTHREEVQIRLQVFFEEYFTLHLEEPEVARIIHRECEAGFPLVFDIFRETFFRSFETLVQFMQIGQERGLIRDGLDPILTASAMLAGASDIVRKDPLNERIYGRTLKNPDYRKAAVSNLLLFYMEGLHPKSHSLEERSL